MLRHLILIIIVLFAAPAFPAPTITDLKLLVDQKKFPAAARTGQQLLKDLPGDFNLQFLTAYALQMNRQPKAAAKLYQSLIETHPELPEPRNNLAMIYLAEGDYDQASQLLVDAIYTHNSYATAYQNLSLIYTSIASEAYRRAVSESNEPSKFAQNIELAALSQLGSNSASVAFQIKPEIIPVAKPVDPKPVVAALPPESNQTVKPALVSVVQAARPDHKAALIRQVRDWARAWTDKDFTGYTSNYSNTHRPKFNTHSAWVEYRRNRIMRPGKISVVVSDIIVHSITADSAELDFKQKYDSVTYSDQVRKRLSFSRFGNEWKIIDERVLSVL